MHEGEITTALAALRSTAAACPRVRADGPPPPIAELGPWRVGLTANR